MHNLISKVFDDQLAKVDGIFEISKMIQTAAISQLETIQSYEEGLSLENQHKRTIQLCENGLKLIGGIQGSSIEIAETKSWEKLIPLAIILIVTFTEEFLHEIFKNLIYKNLEKTKSLSDKKIDFDWLVDMNYELTKEQVISLVLRAVYEKEHMNFDNLTGINKTFERFFGIAFDIGIESNKDFYYFCQLRHTLVHRAGRADRKFLDLIAKNEIDIEFTEGETIKLDFNDYEKCKKTFSNFFKTVEDTINDSDLVYEDFI